MDLQLTNKKALVTGSTAGIGFAIASLFAQIAKNTAPQKPRAILGGTRPDSWDGAQRETGSWWVEVAGRLRNPCRNRARRDSAYYAALRQSGRGSCPGTVFSWNSSKRQSHEPELRMTRKK
jgi:NAD(P)-dependent dehydrogenase (short-subunit alcohol dehydrogenase family)